MTIAELAKITGLTTHTLRYYEKIGIMPLVARNPNGIRNYSTENLQRIELVQQLKASGMSLENILIYLQTMGAGRKAEKARTEVLLQTRRQLVEKVQELQQALKQLDVRLGEQHSLYTIAGGRAV